jgi:hypothetical protein
MRYFFILVLVLAGCASVSDVFPVGKDTYTVSSKLGGPGSSWSEAKQLAIAKGNEYCAGLGKQMVVGKFDTHGVRGFSPLNAELTFQCVEK